VPNVDYDVRVDDDVRRRVRRKINIGGQEFLKRQRAKLRFLLETEMKLYSKRENECEGRRGGHFNRLFQLYGGSDDPENDEQQLTVLD